MLLRIWVAVLLFGVSGAAGVMAQASSAPGCVVNKGYYRCNQLAFARVLKDAKSVALVTQPFDRGTTKALSNLTESLGKTEASEASADLTFVLTKILGGGIDYGPGGGPLASLNVYSRGAQGAHGDLIWTEVFNGQPDLAWPAVVHLTIEQFKSDIK